MQEKTDKLNVEIKAKCAALDAIRQKLLDRNADYIGLDHQIDTYFVVPDGRMKLRQGNIENSLIFYKRNNQAGPKASFVKLMTLSAEKAVETLELLRAALGILKVVDKQREIYFIDNVKFHIDEVQTLGSFVEIEAIDSDGSLGRAYLQNQCTEYMEYLAIKENDLLESSYSDMVQ